jgi:hypothetical protein
MCKWRLKLNDIYFYDKKINDVLKITKCISSYEYFKIKKKIFGNKHLSNHIYSFGIFKLFFKCYKLLIEWPISAYLL